MKLQRTVFLALVVMDSGAMAFWASLPRRQPAGEQLSMAPLSNEEIFARAQQQKQQTAAEQEPPPMLFDEEMLGDMQAALLLLEKRVKEGPLTISEVDQLTDQFSKIQTEMRENEHKKPTRPKAAAVSSTPTIATVTPPAPANTAAPSGPVAETTAATATEASAGPTINSAPQVIDIDTPSDEGAAYSGRGGMGQAADTVNTYVIPGMESMSPAEYQEALQRSVIERQKRRRETMTTGNRATWDYLKQLQYPSNSIEK